MRFSILLGLLLLLNPFCLALANPTNAKHEEGVSETTNHKHEDAPIQVTCEKAANHRVKMTIRNVSDRTVYLFDDPRMPYTMLIDGNLAIVQAIHPPIDGRLVSSLWIPPISPIQPGETFEHIIRLLPVKLMSYLEEGPTQVFLYGRFPVQCWSSWIEEIPDHSGFENWEPGIDIRAGVDPVTLFEWQAGLVSSEVIEVNLTPSIRDWIGYYDRPINSD